LSTISVEIAANNNHSGNYSTAASRGSAEFQSASCRPLRVDFTRHFAALLDTFVLSIAVFTFSRFHVKFRLTSGGFVCSQRARSQWAWRLSIARPVFVGENDDFQRKKTCGFRPFLAISLENRVDWAGQADDEGR
jgi:hypothetical protein